LLKYLFNAKDDIKSCIVVDKHAYQHAADFSGRILAYKVFYVPINSQTIAWITLKLAQQHKKIVDRPDLAQLN
jgi:hypothetical protein